MSFIIIQTLSTVEIGNSCVTVILIGYNAKGTTIHQEVCR